MHPNDQLRALREGGATLRCHTNKHIGDYTVGQHSYDAAAIIFALHPAPTLNLIKAMLFHDVAERWVGDAPAPAKWHNEALGEEYAKAELVVMEKLGLEFNLTFDELQWLHGADRLELFLWCHDQLQLGNQHIRNMLGQLHIWFEENQAGLPPQINEFFRDFEWKRLNERTPS